MRFRTSVTLLRWKWSAAKRRKITTCALRTQRNFSCINELFVRLCSFVAVLSLQIPGLPCWVSLHKNDWSTKKRPERSRGSGANSTCQICVLYVILSHCFWSSPFLQTAGSGGVHRGLGVFIWIFWATTNMWIGSWPCELAVGHDRLSAFLNAAASKNCPKQICSCQGSRPSYVRNHQRWKEILWTRHHHQEERALVFVWSKLR